MKLLYTSSNVMVVSHLRNLVEAAGIECQIKNEFLYSIAGEVPPTMIWPELWVSDNDFDHAQVIMQGSFSDKSALPHWQCGHCGEWVEGQFELCWNCGEVHKG